MNDKTKSEILQQAAAKHPLVTNPIATGMNVVTKDEYTNLARFVFSQVVDVLSKSYGPYGSMSLINRAGYRFSTKDGWRILMYTVFDNNQYYQAIHRMIFEVCEQMNDRVGDGTTTVILIANRIYEELVKNMDTIESFDLPPRDIFKSFDDVVERVTEVLEKTSRYFTERDIRNIASISTNNDEAITNCLCALYSRDRNADIQIMESNKIGVSVEEIDGLKIPVQLIDRIYVNNQVEKCCDVEDAVYLVFNHKVGENAIGSMILPCEAAAKQLGKKLVVIAPAYEESILIGYWLKKTSDEFRSTGTTTTILLNYKPTILGTAGADDLAILLDTHPIDGRIVDAFKSVGDVAVGMMNDRVVLRNTEAKQEIVLGRCDKAKLGYEQMSFFSGLHPISSLLEAQIATVKAEIEALEESMTVTEKATSVKISSLKKRLARLEMKMSVIYYGADSTFDKEMLHDTIEDGVRALESARAHGVIKGSQYDLLNACKTVYAQTPETDVITRIILESICTGIVNMLTKDLYGKSKAFQLGESIHNKDVVDPEDYPGMRDRIMATADIYDHDLCNLWDINYLSDMQPLNLITLEPDSDLITSTETDICALKASIELIKILIAGNQLLMIDA